MVCAPVRSIIPELKLGDYLSVQAHKTCSISHLYFAIPVGRELYVIEVEKSKDEGRLVHLGNLIEVFAFLSHLAANCDFSKLKQRNVNVLIAQHCHN